jgi:ATP/maltotriose-dependent transcriptional regulator MalT
MQKSDLLLRTKIHLPSTRPHLVSRPRLCEQILAGLRGPLTLIIAPAGFGKTTLVTSCVTDCGIPVAWLSLDKDDNQARHFLNYLIAAVREADNTIGNESAQRMGAMQQALPEAVLTSLINDLDVVGREMILVLDDYQFISNQAVHEAVAFLLERCPKNFHLVIATRSDPPLSLARLRARGQTVELRAEDLSFTEPEAAQFLNEVMGLCLDVGSVAALAERTEGWIAGLQMAALSMRDRKDVARFIEGFSGTNRYILDYLLEEVLASQPPQIQRFLLHTSILERLTAPLCDVVLANDEEAKRKDDAGSIGSESIFLDGSAPILEYMERANLFLVPLDDDRTWYRYHHLFADLLRAQLLKSLGAQGVNQLHVRASEWHAENGSILEAINHASAASDDERVERFIEQHYMEMVNRGEMSGYRFWTGKLSKELVYRRPWLCIYEAYSHSWFGELDDADRLLEVVEKCLRSEISAPDAQSMQGQFAYVKSRVTAMRGDLPRAIEFCLAAREHIPASNLALQLDSHITLGYEYFLAGDYANAIQILNKAIRSGITAGAIIYTVASSCILARLIAIQGLLTKSYDTYQMAAQSIPETSGEHRDATALVEVGIADVLCEWNDLAAALAHVKQGLALLPFWGKVDDLAMAYITLARIYMAQANKSGAVEAMEKAIQVIQTSGVFPEALYAAEFAQVKLWLAQGDIQTAARWAASLEQRFGSDNPFKFENEVTHIAQARVLIAQKKPDEAIDLLSRLEDFARSDGRMGRVIEILLLQALAMQESGDSERAILALTKCLTLAKPEGYVRVFLDEGQPMRLLLAQWLPHASSNSLRNYAASLLSQFDDKPQDTTVASIKSAPGSALIEPLTPRELEVFRLLAEGFSNRQIATQLVLAEGTVKFYMHSIMQKLGVHSRTQALVTAREQNLI